MGNKLWVFISIAIPIDGHPMAQPGTSAQLTETSPHQVGWDRGSLRRALEFNRLELFSDTEVVQ